MNDQFSLTNVKWITMGMGYGGKIVYNLIFTKNIF